MRFRFARRRSDDLLRGRGHFSGQFGFVLDLDARGEWMRHETIGDREAGGVVRLLRSCSAWTLIMTQACLHAHYIQGMFRGIWYCGCLAWVPPPIRGSNRWVRVNCYHDMAAMMFRRSALLNGGERR